MQDIASQSTAIVLPGKSKITYHEVVDVKRLHWIIQNADKLNLGKSYVSGKYVEGDAQLTLVKKYYKRMIEGKGTVTQTYFQHNGHGRRFSEETGLQNLSRKIRHTVSRGILRDIDMSNCHPVLLQWYCEQNGIPCTNLTYYNMNRKQCLHELMEGRKLTKDDAKKMLLKAVNKQHNQYQQMEGDPDWLYDFHSELRQISIEVMIKNPDLEIESRKKRDYNISGSTINRLLCNLENQALSLMEMAIRRIDGAEVCVLAFDGLMVYGLTDVTIELALRSCEEIIKSEMGISIQVCEKIMDEGFNVPDSELLPYFPWEKKSEYKRLEKQLALQKETESFLSLVHSFEINHAKIIATSNFITVTSEKDVIFMSRSKLRDSYEHIRYGEDKSFIDAWCKYPSMRLYDRVDVIPKRCPDNIYNLWTPFACESPHEYSLSEEVSKGRDFLLSHISILCNHDEAMTDYITKWVAQMLQYPEHKTRMPTFISGQGAGKDSFLEWLRKLLGTEHVMETTDPERDVWGEFNDALKGNTYLVCLNELSKKATMDAEEKIKGLIVDPWLYINPKGKGKYKIRSYHRFIAFTNNPEPIKSTKDDRRNVIIKSSNEKIGDTGYFNQFYSYLDNKDVIQACYDYLMSLDVATFHQLKNTDIPITNYQRDLQELSVSPIEQFVRYLVTEDPQYSEYETFLLSSSEILTKFREFINLHQFKYEVNSVSLGVRLKNLNISGVKTGIHTKQGNKTEFIKKEIRIYLRLDNIVLTK